MDSHHQQFCLRWNNHQTSLLSSLPALLDSSQFTDVTLSAEGRSIRAHKIVLSSCSSYFMELFGALGPLQHPVVIIPGASFTGLCALVTFMYSGEVNIYEEQLPGILNMAEALGIKGLADVNGNQSKVNLNYDTSLKEHPSSESFLTKLRTTKFFDDFPTISNNGHLSDLSDPINMIKNTINAPKCNDEDTQLWPKSQPNNIQKQFPKPVLTGTTTQNILANEVTNKYSADKLTNKRSWKTERKVPESRKIDRIVDLLKYGNKPTIKSEVEYGESLTSLDTSAVAEIKHNEVTDLSIKNLDKSNLKLEQTGIEMSALPHLDSKKSGTSKIYATCFICHKQLSNQYNLRVHLETHQNVQYACGVCSHVSRSKDALRKHVSYRHPGTPYVDTSHENKRKRSRTKIDDVDNVSVKSEDKGDSLSTFNKV